MTPDQRVALITERLTESFSPTYLNIIDDSADHAGHAGSRGGAGYYTIQITTSALKDRSRVEAHRAIYMLLNDLIPTEIHALQIKLI